MPKKIERKLMRQAAKLHLKGSRRGAYVYGTLRRIESRKK